MLLSVLHLSVSLQMETCYTLQGQSLESGRSYMFQAVGNILNSKQKQQNTKVKVKETDPKWSQICPSLLQVLHLLFPLPGMLFPRHLDGFNLCGQAYVTM